LTSPESDETLEGFYRHVRPGGPGWNRQRLKTGLAPIQDLGLDIQKAIAAIILLLGSLLSVGGFLLLQETLGWICLVLAVLGGVALRQLNQTRILPMPRPGLDDEDLEDY
ncbi:MAG: sodium:proline symporter, partial [Cyanobacteriota bacterium]|nr:sodium:proline symporter [Cyanobacteriota bacterium]